MDASTYDNSQDQSTSIDNELNREMEVADIVAALLLQTIHCKWQPAGSEKEKLLDTLSQRPGLDRTQSDELLGAASFLLHFYVSDGFSRLLKQAKGRFSEAQKQAIVEMMEEVAAMDGLPSDRQRKLIEQTVQTLR